MDEKKETVESKANETVHLSVPDMSCAGCVEKVEKSLSSVPGVKNAQVNFADRSASVECDVSPELLIKAVSDAGYTASVAPQATDTGAQVKYNNREVTSSAATHNTMPPMVRVFNTRPLVP